ncbi:ABC transporter permease [Sporolituus thermophilus]|uniref:Iron(III) transport system permease protein n=1 Tax=Sporolituus thermophilus DSM 23256 TaxID=1123285 RepID=A0A1G7IM54_9FIRM|nr:iron ABC transporter permease [Sporolituus thermophilus]SDF13807.1 iron(III) transport system permease protein [Sporolituus thermophilus DSM 23256]
MKRWAMITTSPWFVYVLIAPLALVLAGYVVYPMLQTFWESLQTETGLSGINYLNFFDWQHSSHLEALLTSIFISVLSVVSCGIVGVTMAFLLTRYDFPGRRILSVLVMAPMGLPPLVGVLSFVFLFSESGIIPRLIKELFGLAQVPFYLKGIAGVIAVHTFTMYTYFYMTASAALAGFDHSLEEAAYSLGASRWQVWRKIILPMLTPAIISASLLVFMMSMASYTAPLIFGIERTMTMQIYLSRTNGNLDMAATQSVILSSVSIALLFIMRWYQERRNYINQSKGVSAHRSEITSRLGRMAAIVLSVIGVVILLLPIFTIVLLSFVVEASWTTQALPPHYTFDHYFKLFTDSRTWAPIRTSFEMSMLATIGNVVFGVAAAYLMSRFDFKGKYLMDMIIMIPWALPGTVVAINLIAAFNQPTLWSLNQVLVGTYWILPLAYFVRNLPLVFRSSAATFAQFDPSIEDAARSLGASWWYSFRRVVLPVTASGILAGTLLAFVQGVGEFVASILLFTVNTTPLSVAIFQRMYAYEIGAACAYGTLQIVMIATVLFVTQKLTGDKMGTSCS